MLKYADTMQIRDCREDTDLLLYKQSARIVQQYTVERRQLQNVVIRITSEQFYQARFRMLADEWRTGTKFMSSVTDIVNHPAYQAIIAMGSIAIPFILEEMSQHPGHWFVALEKLTGKRPLIAPEHVGNLQKLTEAWLTYGNNQCV